MLVNNAGIMPLGSVLKEPDAVARAIMDVNVHGIINGTKAVAPGMVERGSGHIVNVASAVGRLAVADGATLLGLEVRRRRIHRGHPRRAGAVRRRGQHGAADGGAAPSSPPGVPAARGVKAVSAEQVAEVIVSTLRRPRAELWVPRYVQGMTRVSGMLPRRAAGGDRPRLPGRPGAGRPGRDPAGGVRGPGAVGPGLTGPHRH